MQSYSWEGEDILARKIMLDVFGLSKGKYLDIGAHHPFNLSNTALLYSEGWRGVNIDAMPGSMREFEIHRKDDVNLEVAIAPRPGRMRFTTFNDPGLNGFVDDEQIYHHKRRGVEVLSQLEIECKTISSVLAEHEAGDIDLMSIDVEGLDGEIIANFPFDVARPKLVIVEMVGCHSASDVKKTMAHRSLRRNDYMLFSRLHMSCIYVDRIAYCAKISTRTKPYRKGSWRRWAWLKCKIKLGLIARF